MVMTILLAIGTTLLHPTKKQISKEQETLLADAWMENVTALIMDKQGKVNMKIITPKLVHYAKNDVTDFSMPEITLYRNSRKPWFITAKYAKAAEGLNRVNFWDNVVIHHSADERTPATVIKTKTLTVFPKQQTAETDDLITLVQPNILVKAVGMNTDLNTGNIKLLSQARGEYVSNS